MSWFRAAAAVAVTAVSVAACDSSGGADSGESDALYPAGYGHHLCTPSARATTFTEGLDTFANRGPAPVTIQKVEWPTQGDVTVDSVRVFQRQPGDHFATLGLWSGLPQDGLTGSARRAWERGQPAEGAELGLADADEGYLVFVIGVSGTEGSGGPLTVHFTDGEGHSGTATSLVDLRVTKRCPGVTS